MKHRTRARYTRLPTNSKIRALPVRPSRSSLRLSVPSVGAHSGLQNETTSINPMSSSPPNVRTVSSDSARRLRPRGRPPLHRKRLVHFPDPDSSEMSHNWSYSLQSNESVEDPSDYVPSFSNPSSGSDTDVGSRSARRLRPRIPPIATCSASSGQAKRIEPGWIAGPPKHRRRIQDEPHLGEEMQESCDVNDGHTKDEEDGRSDQEKNDIVNGDTRRRYPVRNRRHTAVYQIEYPQHSHSSTRNWLAGTGYEYGGRRRNSRNRPHRGLQHCGSHTSSSDSDSSGSTSNRAPYRHTSHASWHPETGRPNETDPDEIRFARRCTKSIMHARSELLPINLKRADPSVKSVLNDRLLSGACLADIEPMKIDESVGFDQVGGHHAHIMALKESIILPLMYPEVFSTFSIDPPRGVLFSGPPGTGKTLLARALANECSRMTSTDATGVRNAALHRPIAFFMRKGADCLSKWVGESERQLRLLFDQAYRMRPSIIFFDEIDGLAPVRSSKQDQIHSSIVSTLLSLMDGLDSRAEVVIIGATNRPDAIDPALRRPGRFDREFIFTLPSESVRLRILEVHTSRWNPKPDSTLLEQLAYVTGNYSGADLKALTTEACLSCLRRQYPQVYRSQVKLALDKSYLVVSPLDWLCALQLVRPSIDRSVSELCSIASSPAANALSTTRRTPLSSTVSHLLGVPLSELVQLFTRLLERPWDSDRYPEDSTVKVIGTSASSKIILSGDVPDCLIAAVWHKLELVQVFSLSYANLVAFPTSVGVCPEAAIAQVLSSVRRATTTNTTQSLLEATSTQGVILFIPQIDVLLNSLSRSASYYLIEQLDAITSELVMDECHLLPSTTSLLPFELNRAVSHRAQRLLIVATLSKRWSKWGLFSCEKTRSKVIAHTSQKHARSSSSSGRFSSPRTKSVLGEKLCNGFTCGHESTQRARPEQSIPLIPSPTFENSSDESCLAATHGRSGSTDSVTSVSEADAVQPADIAVASRMSELPTLKLNSFGVSHSRKRFLMRFVNNQATMQLYVSSPCKKARASFFTTLLTLWSNSVCGRRINSGASAYDELFPVTHRAPSPLPVEHDSAASAATESRVQLSSEELAAIEHEECQLFRRLRQVLRRVVAHLARHRRFAVFARPVQLDEAPDYYEVIKQPMDLGTVRDRIDAKQYTNVEDFMRDIELIYYNALEYNPANVPRSHDIRSRASEFWDEACLQIEEELHPPDLNERCKAAIRAQASRATQTVDLSATVSETRSDQRCTKSSLTSTVDVVHEPVVKLYPMPQGDRYSRRLHGQPPVLEPADIEILQNITARRRSSLCTLLPTSETSQLREKLGLEENSSVVADPQPNSYLNSSFHVDADKRPCIESLSSSPICNKTINPVFSASTSPTVFQQTKSPDLSTTINDSNLCTTVACQLDNTCLESFLQEVVEKTHGWCVDKLLELHREFTYAIRRRPAATDDVKTVVSDLECIFNLRCDRTAQG